MDKLTNENFDDIINGDMPVIIDFYADWCNPCKLLKPTIDKLKTDLDGQALVYMVNVEEAMDLAASLGIRNIPTVLVYKDGIRTTVVNKTYEGIKAEL